MTGRHGRRQLAMTEHNSSRVALGTAGTCQALQAQHECAADQPLAQCQAAVLACRPFNVGYGWGKWLRHRSVCSAPPLVKVLM